MNYSLYIQFERQLSLFLLPHRCCPEQIKQVQQIATELSNKFLPCHFLRATRRRVPGGEAFLPFSCISFFFPSKLKRICLFSFDCLNQKQNSIVGSESKRCFSSILNKFFFEFGKKRKIVSVSATGARSRVCPAANGNGQFSTNFLKFSESFAPLGNMGDQLKAPLRAFEHHCSVWYWGV